MRKFKFLFLGLSVFMIGLVIFTSMKSDLFHLPEAVVKEPWFWTTLVDFYFNIAVISAWTLYKESNLAKGIAWVIGYVLLGSIATCFYVFLQFLGLKEGDDIKQVLIRRNE